MPRSTLLFWETRERPLGAPAGVAAVLAFPSRLCRESCMFLRESVIFLRESITCPVRFLSDLNNIFQPQIG